MLAGLFDPLGEPAAMKRLAESGATVFAIDLLPRITRAQPMDVLSSQATVAGYKAVIVAASLSPRLFPMLTYAAGTIPPAKVLVLGAGVAGLQAIATARRLGANVSAYDVRAAVREQIESLGARFVDLADVAAGEEDASGYATGADEAELARQREALAAEIARQRRGRHHRAGARAAVPDPGHRGGHRGHEAGLGDRRPRRRARRQLRGHCRRQDRGDRRRHPGRRREPPGHRAAGRQPDARRNLANFVLHIAKDGDVDLDGDDPIVQGTLVARGGKVVHERVAGAARRAPSATEAGA